MTLAEMGAVENAIASPLDKGKKRTVVLLQTQAEGAGAQEISRILGNGLASRNYDVHHIFLYRRTGAHDGLPQVNYCAETRPRNPLEVFRMVARLIRQLRRIGPDAMIAFQHYGNFAGALGALAAGIPVVIANRTSAKEHMPVGLRTVDMLFGLMGLYSKVVTNSEVVDQEYDRYPSAYKSRVVRIDHGFAPKTTNLDAGAARRSLGLPSGVTLLGCVARLSPLKNVQAIIRLLPDNPAWHLALAGQGPSKEDLETLAKELGVSERVHFVGELTTEGVGRFLKAIDVFVFPSLAETFGLAPVEAAEAGVPVVANDLVVLREVLHIDGQDCALFADAGRQDEFSRAIRQVLSDSALRERLIRGGRKLGSRYPADKMVDAYKDLLEACK